MTPIAVPSPFPSIPHPLPNTRIPAATFLMAKQKAKAKSSKRKKQDSDSESGGLEPNEYVVGTSLDATSVRTRSHPQRVHIERILQAKTNIVQKSAVHWVSALLHRLPYFPQPDTPASPQLYLVKVCHPARPLFELLVDSPYSVERL